MDPQQLVEDWVKQAETRFTTLETKITKLNSRQIINISLIALVIIGVIVAIFFVKSSFTKYKPDYTLIDSLQKERAEILNERLAWEKDREDLNNQLQQHATTDSLLQLDIERQQANILTINRKLKILNDEYKNIPDFSQYNSDQLKKFFANLK